ncbi:antirepressor protein Ant [Rosenbergiella sp. S61]|uniref:Antirepressor protein Ant n=1 Tax=Rosenbergiella gaditana TaxID=2726987 RepID=A0ABS5T0X4_9GAMM|nr:phage antirepressor N-terminal domain-containing protein [Rosenbergiella gaditana]MBT0725403.1 antirepressor protein Ant [Rosenbergiella gaditana]
MNSLPIADHTINVPFHGASLYVVTYGGEAYTPMRPIIDGMGMDWASQFTKLKQRFKSTVVEITMVAADGKSRAMTCLALRKLNGWLQTISPNKVKAEIRDKVIQYQEECDDVLYEYWTKGEVKNPRAIRKSTTEERTPLRDAVNMLVSKKHLMYPEAYALVHQRFQVTSFEQLTPEQIEPAIEYVHSIILEGELLSRDDRQMTLPLAYPMSFYDQYRHVIKPTELKAPWTYAAKHLIPNGDNPNPLGKILTQLKDFGYEIEAARFQLLSLQHHIEIMQHKFESIERAVMR